MERPLRFAALVAAASAGAIIGGPKLIESTIGSSKADHDASVAESVITSPYVDLGSTLTTSAPDSPLPTTTFEAQFDPASCVPTELKIPEVQPLFPNNPNVVPQVGLPAVISPDQASQPENEAKSPDELLYEEVIQFAETALRNGFNGDSNVTVEKGYQRTGSYGGYFLGSIEHVNGSGDKTVITGRVDNWQTGTPELTAYGVQFGSDGESYFVNFGFNHDMRPVARPFTSQGCDQPGRARSITVEEARDAFRQMNGKSSFTSAAAAPTGDNGS